MSACSLVPDIVAVGWIRVSFADATTGGGAEMFVLEERVGVSEVDGRSEADGVEFEVSAGFASSKGGK